jgi:hypothetical protein
MEPKYDKSIYRCNGYGRRGKCQQKVKNGNNFCFHHKKELNENLQVIKCTNNKSISDELLDGINDLYYDENDNNYIVNNELDNIEKIEELKVFNSKNNLDENIYDIQIILVINLI